MYERKHIHLGRLEFCFQSTLPTVFDDTLSYYEDINKIAKYVNDSITVIEGSFNELSDNFNSLKIEFDNLHNDFNTLENKFNDLLSDFTDLNNNFIQLRTEVNEFKTYVDNTITSMRNELNNVKSDVAANTENIATILTTIGNINDSIGRINTKLSTLETNVLTIEGRVDVLESSLDSTLESVNNIRNDLTALQNNVNNDISAINSKVSKLESDISTIDSNVLNLSGRTDSLETISDKNTEDIKKLDDNILNLAGRTDDVENSLDNLTTTVSNNTTEINAIDMRVESLEDTVANIGTITTPFENYIVGGYTAGGQLESNVSIAESEMAKWLKEGSGVTFKFKYYLDRGYNQSGLMFIPNQENIETFIRSNGASNVKNIVLIYDMRFLTTDFDATVIQQNLDRTLSSMIVYEDFSNYLQRFRYYCNLKNKNLIVTMFPLLRNKAPTTYDIQDIYNFYQNLKKLCTILGIPFIDLVNYQNFGNQVQGYQIENTSWLNESDIYSHITGSDYYYTETYYQQLYKVLGHKLKDYLIYNIDTLPPDE